MKRFLKIAACLVGALFIQMAIQPKPKWIEGRPQILWNGNFGNPLTGFDVFNGPEVHGWVLPATTRPVPVEEMDPYPPGWER